MASGIMRSVCVLAALLSGTVLLGCESTGSPDFLDPTLTPNPVASTTDRYLEAVLVQGTPVVYEAASLPAGQQPAPALAGPVHCEPGATVTLQVDVPPEATELLLAVEGATAGHYRVVLPAKDPSQPATTAERTFVTFSPSFDLSSEGITVLVSTRGSEGISLPTSHHLHRAPEPTDAALRVQLDWTARADFDLHLMLPDARDLHWGAPILEGGVLEAEALAGCDDPTGYRESIVFADAPPVGVYEVRVSLWSVCTTSDELPFAVTVWREGEELSAEGTLFAVEAEPGAEGSGYTALRFTVE